MKAYIIYRIALCIHLEVYLVNYKYSLVINILTTRLSDAFYAHSQ